MKSEELRAELPNRITQIKQRVIRRLEDDMAIAMMIGDERGVMEIEAKITALEAMSSPMGGLPGDNRATRVQMRRMFNKG